VAGGGVSSAALMRSARARSGRPVRRITVAMLRRASARVTRLDDDRPSGTDVDQVAQGVLGAVAVQEAVRALLPDGG
jgi:hypothetical protein